MLKDGLEYTIHIHRATLAPNSKRYGNKAGREVYGDEQGSTEEQLHFETDRKDSHHNTDSLYVVGKIVLHIHLEALLKYVVNLYSHGKADDSPESPHGIPPDFIDNCWRRLEKRWKRKARSRANYGAGTPPEHKAETLAV